MPGLQVTGEFHILTRTSSSGALVWALLTTPSTEGGVVEAPTSKPPVVAIAPAEVDILTA